MEFSEYLSPRFSENLAFDEWLLERASKHPAGTETLRLWRPATFAVVIGRGSKFEEEVDTDFCHNRQIPIFRRHSGGAAIVTGPGCWMYSVVLDLNLRPQLRDLNTTHRVVMEQVRRAAQALSSTKNVEIQGICDLTVDGRKCSGNSLRVVRDHLLYHGTLLVDFDLPLLAQCLRTPPRQPDYRQSRPHEQFVANVVDRGLGSDETLWETWRNELKRGWGIPNACHLNVTPEDQIAVAGLATEKYESCEWTRAR